MWSRRGESLFFHLLSPSLIKHCSYDDSFSQEKKKKKGSGSESSGSDSEGSGSVSHLFILLLCTSCFGFLMDCFVTLRHFYLSFMGGRKVKSASLSQLKLYLHVCFCFTNLFLSLLIKGKREEEGQRKGQGQEKRKGQGKSWKRKETWQRRQRLKKKSCSCPKWKKCLIAINVKWNHEKTISVLFFITSGFCTYIRPQINKEVKRLNYEISRVSY